MKHRQQLVVFKHQGRRCKVAAKATFSGCSKLLDLYRHALGSCLDSRLCMLHCGCGGMWRNSCGHPRILSVAAQCSIIHEPCVLSRESAVFVTCCPQFSQPPAFVAAFVAAPGLGSVEMSQQKAQQGSTHVQHSIVDHRCRPPS